MKRLNQLIQTIIRKFTMLNIRYQSIQKLVETVRSGVIHIEFLTKNEVIGSGSGFLCDGYLITNNHVYAGALNAEEVRLAWQPMLSPQSRSEITLSSVKFKNHFKAGSAENSYDFAILNIPELHSKNLFNFKLNASALTNIGDEAIILGFPLEHRNLVCHEAMISSVFINNNVNIIQLDASVNQSNSGGPLVDLKTGDVIGIVTRKGTGLTKIFDELLLVLDQNIEAAQKAPGGIIIGGVDPRKALIAGQNQIKVLALEILRSANVGIGYAFSIDYIKTEIDILKKDK